MSNDITEKPQSTVITGTATTRLVLETPEASTPEEAVESFIEQVIRDGLNGMVFVVNDDEGNVWYVRDGELVSIQEVDGQLVVTDYYTGSRLDEDEEDDEA